MYAALIHEFMRITRIKTPNPKLQTLNPKGGFTLIEMLVAITVLLLSIGGPLTIAAQAVFSSNIARDRLTAAYLAQEGIELTRYLRDNNAVTGAGWISGLDNCVSPNTCILGPGQDPTPRLCSGSCDLLRYRDDMGRYIYSPTSFPESIFRRTITIEEVVADQEVRVTSEVEWQAGGRTHRVTLTENLFNWR